MSVFMKIWNGFNRAILPSRFHGLASKHTLLITLTGRKTGRKITVPVNYSQEGRTVRITSQPERQWWRNLEINPEVQLTLRGKVVPGTAQVFETPNQVAEELTAFLRPLPKMAKYYHVGLNEDGTPEQASLAQSAKNLVLIRVEIPS